MKIERVTVFSEETLLERLRKVTLKDQPGIKPYADAHMETISMNPLNIAPAQRYVLEQNLHKIQQLRWALYEHDVDLFNISGFVRMHVQGSPNPIDLLPPVVEQSIESNGQLVQLLNDGMHRVFSALRCCSRIKVIAIKGIPKEYPYYAYPLWEADPWEHIKVVGNLSHGFEKKVYRIKQHKRLYRDFNTAFEDVGSSRGFSTPAEAVKAIIAGAKGDDWKGRPCLTTDGTVGGKCL